MLVTARAGRVVLTRVLKHAVYCVATFLDGLPSPLHALSECMHVDCSRSEMYTTRSQTSSEVRHFATASCIVEEVIDHTKA